MSDSRIKNTLLSTSLNIIEQVIAMIFGLIVPRLVIKTFGSEVNGLTAFITQILNVFALLQAGMIGASIFALYEPLAKKDYDQMNIIVDSSSRFFRKIAGIFFSLVLLAIPYIVYKESSTSFARWEIIVTTIIMGLNATLTFLFSSRYDIIISSYQKRFLFSIAAIVNKFVYYGLIFCIIILKKHFVLMYASSLVANICTILILRHYYRQLTKEWLKPIDGKNTYKIQNRNYLLCNQVVYQIINSLPLLLIANFYDLKVASVYSINFTLVNILKMVITAFMRSVTEPFGNYRVTHSKDDVLKMYRVIQAGISFVVIIFSACFVCLSTSFISIYTNNISEVNYVIPIMAFTLLTEFFFSSHKLIADLLIDIHGLYKKIYIPIFISGAISAIAMVLTAKFVDYKYIPLCSALFYLLLYVIFLPIVKKELDISLFFRNYLTVIVSVITIGFIYFVYIKIAPDITNLFFWFVHAIILFASSALLAGGAVAIADIKSVRIVLRKGLSYIRK